jgi:hypothetical protein
MIFEEKHCYCNLLTAEGKIKTPQKLENPIEYAGYTKK